MTLPSSPAGDHVLEAQPDGDCIVIHVPMTFRSNHGRKQIILPEGLAPAPSTDDDLRCPLKLALARGYRWQKMIESGQIKSSYDLARQLRLDQSYVARTIRLTALAPDIVEAVLRGDEPNGLSLKSMRREVPMNWQEQRETFGVKATKAPTRPPMRPK